MEDIKLAYPIHTLENIELFPAEATLSQDSLEALIASNKSSQPLVCLMQYGSVKKDIWSYISEPPYTAIFYDSKKKRDLFNVMEKVEVISPILRCLDYYKENEIYTYRHMLTVFTLSVFLAKSLIPEYKPMLPEFAAAPAHDFGKICVPLNILKKKSPLSKSEHKRLKHHPLAGYVLLSYYLRDSQNITAIVARDHHERRDSSGYPRGIYQSGKMVEIITVGDIYDALISPRPYRPLSYDNRPALEVLTEMAERNKIGWDVVKVLIGEYRKGKSDYKTIVISEEKRGGSPPGNAYGILSDKNIPPDDDKG